MPISARLQLCAIVSIVFAMVGFLSIAFSGLDRCHSFMAVFYLVPQAAVFFAGVLNPILYGGQDFGKLRDENKYWFEAALCGYAAQLLLTFVNLFFVRSSGHC
jgi:hypothetical protein